MKLLVADDDEMTVEMVRNVLHESGYQTDAAYDGAQAFEALRFGDYRMVISDWEMPGMTGLELCHAVRTSGLANYVYFILLTSHDRTQDVVAGLEAGADDYVSKPFAPAELIIRVRAGERILGLETRDLAIFAMAKLAESRDNETGKHLERVRRNSLILAQELRNHPELKSTVTAHFCRLIYLSSPLHDIGKIGVPDGVLLKPGRLSDREFDIMKTHTTIGAETLGAALREYPNAEFLVVARDIAAAHHERYDGEGYPAGLRGDEIPLAARIVALADVYDALISRRVYKGAFSHDVARSIIVEGSGSHFDPRIVDAFIAAEDKFQETTRQFQNTETTPAEVVATL